MLLYVTGTYTIACMGLTALSLLFTVIILHVFHKNAEKRPAQWTKVVILQYLAPLLGFTKLSDVQNRVQPITINGKSVTNQEKEDIKTISDLGKPATGPPYLSVELPQDLLDYFRLCQDKERATECQEEWQRIARVLDRACLVLFLLTLTCLCVAMLLCAML